MTFVGYRAPGARNEENSATLDSVTTQVEALEAQVTEEFWNHAVASGARTARTILRAGASTLSALDRDNLRQHYIEELGAAIVAAKEVEAQAEFAFGTLPGEPRCAVTTASWFSRVFASAPTGEELAALEAQFDKYLLRMDPSARRKTIGRGVYSASFSMRDAPLAISVQWERLKHDQLWRISTEIRIGVRAFCVLPGFVSQELAAATESSIAHEAAISAQQSSPAETLAEPAAFDLSLADEFASLLRVHGAAATAEQILDFDVRSYLVELARITDLALLVGDGRATISFHHALSEDILKCALRILMTLRAAPSTMRLLVQ
jgi:hypothetical protein